MWNAGKFSKGMQIKRWIIMNMAENIAIGYLKYLLQHFCIKLYLQLILFYFRSFESKLVDCSKEVNVVISPANLISECFIYQNDSYKQKEKKVTNFFNKHKNNVDLIVVIIPDFCDMIYGKYKYTVCGLEDVKLYKNYENICMYKNLLSNFSLKL